MTITNGVNFNLMQMEKCVVFSKTEYENLIYITS